MSEENKAIARRFFDLVNDRNLDGLTEIIATDAVDHDPQNPIPGTGPEVAQQVMAGYIQAFPDLRITVDDVVAEGKKVAIRWTATGTHRGNGLGFDATDRQMRMSGMTFVVVRNGKIMEGWDSYDSFGMFQQLGVAQVPALARTP
jgi:steroid delta-isomerase-like uncharacterized protein